jgi:protein-S-isoprenylcysteine O-methyltransferase Ste14
MIVMTDMTSPAHRSVPAVLLRGYAVLAYAAFVASVAWAISFLADLNAVPSVDRTGGRAAWAAALTDVALLGLFAIQHSVMPRPGFKRWLAARLPAGAERSTYVMMSSLILLVLFWQWQPLPAVIWRVSSQPWAGLIWAICALGWAVAVTSTFLVDHLDFLGLKQAGWRGAGQPYEPPSFTCRWFYRWVRHPMMAGLIVAFWATASMTAGHLLFAAAGTGYILVGIRFEERDLRRELGEAYERYAERVPALVPVRLLPRGSAVICALADRQSRRQSACRVIVDLPVGADRGDPAS